MVLGDYFTDVSHANTIVYKFNTYHVNLIQKEHVKLDETFLAVQDRLKAYLWNTLDVLGRLTSKLNETLDTD